MIAFKRHFAPFVVQDEAVYLVSERGVAAIQGDLATALAPLLDGTRGTSEVVAELADRYPPDRVRRAITQLIRTGRVADIDGTADPEHAAYWELGGLDGDQATSRIATARVRLEGHGSVDLAPVELAMDAAGLGIAEHPGEESALTIAICDDYLQPTLVERNAAALAAGEPWLLARPFGSLVWVGPLVVPGQTGCWRCLEHRLSANRQALSYLQSRVGRSTPPVGAGQLPLTVELGARLAALEAARFIASGGAVVDADATGGAEGGAQASVLTFDTLAMRAERHALTRRPQCPACGDGSLMERQGGRPIRFVSRPKAFTADGGHRAKSPEDVLDRYMPQVSPVTGVVTNITRSLGAPPLLKVYTAGQNLARGVDQLHSLRHSLRNLSCGKGMSDTQARASALCEAIERYSGVFQGDEARITARYADLGEDAIHPDRCLLYSEAQYRERAAWNSRGSGFSFVTEPLDVEAPVEFSPVWSLTARRPRWLPTSYLYYGYPRPPACALPVADSNGNAAGASFEDAVLQGFLELVERDSVALWWYNRVGRPAVDLDSFAEPYVDDLRAAYASLGREVWALDLTADFGIPAIGAFSRRTENATEDILIAFGAHLDPRIALLRALTEMNQFLPAVLDSAGSGRGGYGVNDRELLRWWSTATVSNQPYLVPDPGSRARTPSDWAQLASSDIAEDLALAERLVAERGMEMLVLDQTRPDIGLPVAKVIVPGMRHFWARLGPGRLYDVPVELGWLSAPRSEQDMNPIAMFI